MKVRLVAETKFYSFAAENATDHVWHHSADDEEPDQLAEFAGRACYQSWSKPNSATAANQDYLRHIIDSEHFSVLEHASATFYVTGVSRSLTHELVRHRHLSFSQLSQRFVNEGAAEMVIPPLMRSTGEPNNIDDAEIPGEVAEFALSRYRQLVEHIVTNYDVSRKQAREAARCVLPNMTETRIVVTGNHRAWREFITKRNTPSADAEIRLLAQEILRQLKGLAPSTYQDM